METFNEIVLATVNDTRVMLCVWRFVSMAFVILAEEGVS
jgi:hypothetical protein